jgi:glutamate racemase
MIGVFDSGHGGLTVVRALVQRFPQLPLVYLGDHRHVPYGNRPSDEIVALSRHGVDALFQRGCRLVLLGCNTATCVAARTLQKDWLPVSGWTGRNILGIVAPTVEAATQTPWAVTAPQYPQKYNTDIVAVFGTTRTITSHAYPEEIRKRCPEVTVGAADMRRAGRCAIEQAAPEEKLDAWSSRAWPDYWRRRAARRPHRAILGCTHYPWSSTCSAAHLPPFTRCCRSPTWWPTAWRTTCSALRTSVRSGADGEPASPAVDHRRSAKVSPPPASSGPTRQPSPST